MKKAPPSLAPLWNNQKNQVVLVHSLFLCIFLMVLPMPIKGADPINEQTVIEECPMDDIRHLAERHPFVNSATTAKGGKYQEGLYIEKVWLEKHGNGTRITVLCANPGKYDKKYYGKSPKFEYSVYNPQNSLLIVQFKGLINSKIPLETKLYATSPHIDRAYLIRNLDQSIALHIWFNKTLGITYIADENTTRFRLMARPGTNTALIYEKPQKPYWLLWLYPPEKMDPLLFEEKRKGLDEPWIRVYDKDMKSALLNPGWFKLRSLVKIASFHLERQGLDPIIEQVFD